jgi:UDP-N-acetylglucosamine--N-acetylmuramyl-(pentapeptide) pyrophosphoryl-undecaprenol N-acetylglucosamine transferase
MEMEKVPQEGFRIIGLDIAGFNRSNMLKNITLPFKLVASAWKARRILKEFRPDAVVGVGGYASFPVLNAAQGMGIPTLIQEQNSYAGKSNKILAAKAVAVCVAYEGMERFFPAAKLKLTGNPVRHSIANNKSGREEGQAWLGMDPARKTILVVGGSLGARSINEAIDAHLDALVSGGRQLVWQTGKLYYEQAQQRAAAFGDRVKVFEFIREMDKAYAAADLVISRAGALAIAELCIVARPVVFVPYPFAAEDHQTSNAQALVQRQAALMIKDSEVKEQLMNKLQQLLGDDAMQQEMSRQLKQMAVKDADERIARYVLEIAK